MHGLVLTGWIASVPVGSHIPILLKDVPYPPEVRAKNYATTETDLYMAAMSMVDFMTGGLKSNLADYPRAIKAHFNAVITLDQLSRPGDAFALRASFDEIIERIWGPRRYRPFPWPREFSRT
jgi:hypothetical protein